MVKKIFYSTLFITSIIILIGAIKYGNAKDFNAYKRYFIRYYYQDYFLNKDCRYCDKKNYKEPNETIHISIKKKKFKELNLEREEYVEKYAGKLVKVKRKKYKVHIYHNNDTIPAKVKLMGYAADHYRDANHFSLRVQCGKNQTLFGMNKFNIMPPSSRNWTIDYLSNRVYSKLSKGLEIHYKAALVQINNEHKNNCIIEEFFHKSILRHDSSGMIFEYFNDTIHLNYPKKENLIQKSMAIYTMMEDIRNTDSSKFFSFINKDKYLDYLAISLLNLSTHHFYRYNLHWYYNSNNNQIEPTLREMKDLILEYDFFIPLKDKWTNLKDKKSRWAYYSEFIDVDCIENETINRDYINYLYADRDSCYIALDQRMLQVIKTYEEILIDDDYRMYINNIGPAHAFDVSNQEDKLRFKINKLKNSFN